jgi:hypothetical protein
MYSTDRPHFTLPEIQTRLLWVQQPRMILLCLKMISGNQ